ncbi:Lipoprotein signal peptidase [Roseimaritima ulvae]|uniref:Lipoprotein signal peptidase n=2 Tax=Roseimaritima ulvae TaxID=980254 RepID=A0A5B9R5X7_9BACT|nr:Lipoprotein signal peptidase [Roseimaritima ulvae]
MLLPPLVVCVIVDQVTKQWATATLKHGETLSFWGDRFRLQYAMNSGGFLSLGSEFSESARFALFIGFNLVLMCGLGWFLYAAPRARRGFQFGVGLLLAGGIGNLIDRLTQNGQVIDFMNLGIGSLRTGIFNVADIAIVAGAVLLAGCSWTAGGTRTDIAR